MKKKTLLFAVPFMALTMAGSLTSCGGSSGSLTIWTFSSELVDVAKNYYTKDTGVQCDVVNKGSVAAVIADFNNALRAGAELPDVIAVEAAKIAAITKQPNNFVDLSTIGNTEQMYEYTKAVATSGNKLIGLSWQATPGGFFYKQSIASKLGITSVDQMETKISTWDGYLALAQQAHDYDLDPEKAGTQSIAITSSISDPIKVFLSERSKSWVDNGVLQQEKVMFGEGDVLKTDNCFDVVRKLHQADYTHQTADRSSGWFADIKSANTLGFFCSSWGLNFDLMENAGSTAGDWRMCKAPSNYFRGGTWLAVPTKANNVDGAKKFIEYLTTNETFLKNRCKEAGDFMNNKKIMQEVINEGYSCAFLGGQNHLAKLYEVAEHINGNLISAYDSDIDDSFQNFAAEFAQFDVDPHEIGGRLVDARENYLDGFRTEIKSKYPDIILQ